MGRAHKMSNIFEKSDAPIGALVTATVTAPWWEQFVETANKIDTALLMIGGLVLLFLTIYSKVVDIKIKRQQLNELTKPKR